MRARRSASGLLVCALVLSGLSTGLAPASELSARLSEAWRWREHPIDLGEFVPRGVDAFDDTTAVVFSADGAALFDGRRLVVPPGWDLGRPPGRLVHVADGVAFHCRGGIVSVDASGQPTTVEPSRPVNFADLLARRDGTVLTCEGDAVFRIEGREALPWRAGPDPGVTILALSEDADGLLWASTERGVYREGADHSGWDEISLVVSAEIPVATGRIVPAGPRMFLFPSAEMNDARVGIWDGRRLVARSISNIDVHCVPTAVGDAVVTATWSGALRVFADGDPQDVRLDVLRGERIQHLAWVPSGRLFAVTVRGRLLSCDLSSDRWRKHHPADTGPWNVVNTIARQGDALWVGTAAGLARFEDGDFEIVAEQIGDDHLHAITALEVADDGAVWIGSGSGFRGAVRLDEGGLHRHFEEEGVSDAYVHNIRRGHDGALWFALIDNYRHPPRGGGLARLKDGAWSRFGREQGLPIERCYDVLDTESRTLAATAVRASEWVDGEWRDFGLREQRMFRLFERRDGSLWSGPGIGEQGVFRYEHGTFERLRGAGADALSASDFAETSDGKLWITGDHGLAMLDAEGVVHEIGREPGAPAVRTWPIECERDGVFWIGSLGQGLLRFAPDDLDAPRVIDVTTTPAGDGSIVRAIGRDPWDVTPSDRLRFRARVGDGEWSEPFGHALVLPDAAAGDEVSIVVLDLSGNTSAATSSRVSYLSATDSTQDLRTAGAATIVSLVTLALFLQLRRVRERRDARERARRRLEESEHRYRSLVEGADVVLCSFDADGTPTYVSPRLGEICGVAPDALDPGTIATLVHDEDRPALTSQEERRRRGDGDPHGVEFRLRGSNGGWRWFWQVQSVRRDRRGEVLGFDTVALDVTERRRLQEALLHAQKLESLGVMAGGVAHDFNNLLVGVIGNAELLRRELTEDPPRLELVGRIERAGREAASLCRRMLAYAGRAQVDFTNLDLTGLVEGMEDLLRSTVPGRIALTLEPSPPAWIDGDSAQLKQIVLNLVLNAAEAIGERSGTVRVRIFSVDESTERPSWFAIDHLASDTSVVVLEVADDGGGIDDADLPRIFDPFFSTKFDGRGLGLASVAGIVKAHRGSIEVGVRPGQGTTFCVWLPATDARDAAPPRPEVGGDALSGRVLLVDDDPAVSGVAAAMLDDLGLEPVLAAGGDEALAIWSQDHESFDVVLLDVTMPDRDGIEVLREMRGADPAARVILTTGYAREETERRCGEVTPDGFLAKPYSSSDLERELRRVLGNGDARRGTA